MRSTCWWDEIPALQHVSGKSVVLVPSTPQCDLPCGPGRWWVGTYGPMNLCGLLRRHPWVVSHGPPGERRAGADDGMDEPVQALPWQGSDASAVENGGRRAAGRCGR